MSWLDLATFEDDNKNTDYESLFYLWKTEDAKYLKREIDIQSFISENKKDIEDKLKDVNIYNVKSKSLYVQELFFIRELEKYKNMNDEVGQTLINKKLEEIRSKIQENQNEQEPKVQEVQETNTVDGKFVVPQIDITKCDLYKNIIIAGGHSATKIRLIKKIIDINKYQITYVFGDVRNECDFIPAEYKFQSNNIVEILKQLFGVQYQKEINSKPMAKILIILYNAGQYLENTDLHIYFGVSPRYMSFIVIPDTDSNPKYLSLLEINSKKFGYCFFANTYGINVRNIMANFTGVSFSIVKQLFLTLPTDGFIVTDTSHPKFLQYHIL